MYKSTGTRMCLQHAKGYWKWLFKSYKPAAPSKHCCNVLLRVIIAAELWFVLTVWDLRVGTDLLAVRQEKSFSNNRWAVSSEFGTYHLCEQQRFRRACASVQSRQNLHCSLIQAVNHEEPSDRKPDPWLLWMAGHAQLKFVVTECSKTQNRLTGLRYW